MEFHADINAAINVLNLGRLEMEPFPAVGRIVERQKDGTVVYKQLTQKLGFPNTLG